MPNKISNTGNERKKIFIVSLEEVRLEPGEEIERAPPRLTARFLLNVQLIIADDASLAAIAPPLKLEILS